MPFGIGYSKTNAFANDRVQGFSLYDIETYSLNDLGPNLICLTRVDLLPGASYPIFNAGQLQDLEN